MFDSGLRLSCKQSAVAALRTATITSRTNSSSSMIRPTDGPATTMTLVTRPPQATLITRRLDASRVWTLRAIWFLVFSIVALNAAVLAFFAKIYATNRTRDSILWVFRLFFLYANENDFLLSNSAIIATTYAALSAVYIFFARWQQDFGVHGRFFEVRLLLDEAVEVLSQTYSAYTASLSISNPPLNLCYAIVIFINSISTLVVRRLYRDSLIKQRIAWLVSDFVLDFVWGTAIPVWMSMSLYITYTNYRVAKGDFDATINSTREVERVLVLSWNNFFMSVVPFCNSFLSLAELVSVLKEPPAPSLVAGKEQTVNTNVGPRSRAMRIIHTLTACYGTALLLVSLAANGAFRKFDHVESCECLHRVHPWFSTGEACLGRHVNCTAINISGDAAELNTVLALFDTAALSDLIISDCSSMAFPSALSQFPRLQSISIQKSTVVAWEAGLAPTKALFPGLKTIYLSDLEIPNGLSGLVSQPLSSSLEWMGLFSISNITTLLTSVEGTGFWQHILYFDCENSGLTTFPRVINEMPHLLVIYLIGNDIESIPEDWTGSQQLQTVLLMGNAALDTLPDEMWRSVAGTCELVVVTDTNLSSIPSWLPEAAHSAFRIEADGTPLCAQIRELPLQIQELVNCERHR